MKQAKTVGTVHTRNFIKNKKKSIKALVFDVRIYNNINRDSNIPVYDTG